MKKFILIAAIASGLAMVGGAATVSADQDLKKLSISQLDDVNAAGYYRRSHYKKPSAHAQANSNADAFGRKTSAKTYTATIADSNAGYSGSRSGSYASAKGVWCGACLAY